MHTDNDFFGNTPLFFAWDRERLDAQLAVLGALAVHGDGDLSPARRLFEDYERGMERHLRLEEEVSFFIQVFETTALSRSPGSVAREHARIRVLVGEVGAALAADDLPRFQAAHRRLRTQKSREVSPPPHDLRPERPD